MTVYNISTMLESEILRRGKKKSLKNCLFYPSTALCSIRRMNFLLNYYRRRNFLDQPLVAEFVCGESRKKIDGVGV